ncbi:S ribonuclease [Pyrus ussuriensis x Pyrus communis]|uniref:S ribonuclease n=1 Tax=Pyrus ussuriensis x Pyrus communis TaxID=2448454 RepID=A0A5N5GFU3_9ROSA|nr:S ribonuclease [Pyrus ussuriensis x Pyrus communis]
MIDVIRSDDLIEKYKLHKSGGLVYVRGVMVTFNPSVIYIVLELDPSSASMSSKFNIATSQYDLSVYHRKAYADLLIPLVKGTSNNGNPTLESARVLFAMLTHCDVPFSFLIFKSILSKSKRAGTHQRGSTIHLYQPHHQLPPWIGKWKITYLKFEINSLRKQFVVFKSLVDQSASSPLVSNSLFSPSISQTSLNQPSFLVPYLPVDPSSVSYNTTASSNHYVSINVHQHFSSTPTSKGKHIRFTYSSDEDKDEEGLGHSPCPRDVPVENIIAGGSPISSDDSSQLEEF